MKRGRVTAAILATIAAGTLSITLSAASSASTAPPSAAQAAKAANAAKAAKATDAAKAAKTAAKAAKTAAKASSQVSKHNVVIINCENKPQVEPRDFVLFCADGNAALEGLGWTSWTPKLASATATLVQNDCIPNCVGGHFHKYPVLVVLWRPVSYSHGVRFSELTEIFPGVRPKIFNGHKWVDGPQVVTSSLWPPYRP
jgi:hypothetical protein